MSDSPGGLGALKRLVPRSIKQAAKDALLERKFRRAMRHVARLGAGEVPSRQLFEELQEGWGNEGMAARTDFLEEVTRQAAATTGPVLECGSGLSTLMLGMVAGRRGVETWSLEHMAEWHARVTSAVTGYEVPGVRLSLAPLRDFGDFSWYDPPLALMPAEFRLVVCDGPPGDTPGGRYGLLPVLGERLPAGSLILLDDVERAGELEVLRRWREEAAMSTAVRDTPTGSYALATRG